VELAPDVRPDVPLIPDLIFPIRKRLLLRVSLLLPLTTVDVEVDLVEAPAGRLPSSPSLLRFLSLVHTSSVACGTNESEKNIVSRERESGNAIASSKCYETHMMSSSSCVAVCVCALSLCLYSSKTVIQEFSNVVEGIAMTTCSSYDGIASGRRTEASGDNFSAPSGCGICFIAKKGSGSVNVVESGFIEEIVHD
jgi:hypothetical protein